jgi:hypothetical protein
MIAFPVSLLPVIPIRSTSGCEEIMFPMLDPGPVIKLTAPAGGPTLSTASLSLRAARGLRLGALMTQVLPTASAIFATTITRGTFQGVMMPQTPTGSRLK